MAETLGEVIKQALATQLKRQAPPPAGIQNIPVDLNGMPTSLPFAGGQLMPQGEIFGGGKVGGYQERPKWNVGVNYSRAF